MPVTSTARLGGASYLGFQFLNQFVGAAQLVFQGGYLGLQGFIFGARRRNAIAHRLSESSMCWCGNPMVVRPGRSGNALARKVGM